MKIFIIAALCAMAIAAPSPYGVPDDDPTVYMSRIWYKSLLQPVPQPVYPPTQTANGQPAPSYPPMTPQAPTQPAYLQLEPQPVIQPAYPQPQPQPQIQPSYPQPQPSSPQPKPQPPTQPAYPQPQPAYPQPQPQPQPAYSTKAVYPQEPSKPAEYTDDYPPRPYSFEWEVEDKPSSNNFEHSESSDGKLVSGSYKVNLPDGRRQIVTYRDDGNGYVADVKYEGEAKYPENSKPSYPTNEYVTKKYDVASYPAQVYNTPAPVNPPLPVPQLPYGIGY